MRPLKDGLGEVRPSGSLVSHPHFVCLVSNVQVRKLDENAAIKMEKRRAELGTTGTELNLKP